MNNKCLTEEQIARYIDGLTSDIEANEIIDHCKACKDCAEELSVLIGYNISMELSSDLRSTDDLLNENTGFNFLYLDKNVSEDDIRPNNAFSFIDSNTTFFHPGSIQNHHMPMVAASESNSDMHDRISHEQNSNKENHNQINMEDMNPIQQQYSDTCAIKSQQLILNDFGVDVTEDQLVYQAEQFYIYRPGEGTPMEDVGKLLELNGVHCTQHENATIYDLTAALAQGQKVIIGVDSGELWNNGMVSQFVNQATDRLVGEQADHALIVAGIDTTNPNDVQVILTDPGTGEEAARYPMAQFLDAWQDSGNFMVTTDAPAPLAYNPEMINFDYTEGHIPMIGEMPYEYFEQSILPLSYDLQSYPEMSELLNNDFDGMIAGDISSFSPELIDALQQIPDFTFSGIDMNSPDGISFGSRHMADYYNDQAAHHERMAQYDLDHGNLDSAQNHLRYADDAHNHAMDELGDIDE